MIRCEPKKGSDQVKVTFALPEDTVAGRAAVVGDFNDWDPTATPLRKKGDQRVATVTVPAGSRYAFRYVTEDGRWFNDDTAYGYEANGFGGDNAVIDLSALG
ncbi:MAG TPA: isoamylase early set domain-containing protein [Acidimicrobiales bacterium]|nr:isoamylase early set domain-containing protein [Acidimicrobiales bacterium]